MCHLEALTPVWWKHYIPTNPSPGFPFPAENLAGVGSDRMKWRVDMGGVKEHFMAVKHMRPAREPKTKGTLIVEQHRPVMNKLNDAERQQLMRAGMELIYSRGQPLF